MRGAISLAPCRRRRRYGQAWDMQPRFLCNSPPRRKRDEEDAAAIATANDAADEPEGSESAAVEPQEGRE